MFNLFKRKPRIIPLAMYRQQKSADTETTKYHNGNLTSPHLATGYETPEKPQGDCKLYFIWVHLP